MRKIKEIYRQLPVDIRSILILSDGWLVGSTIDNLLSDKEAADYVPDYDIIVPFSKWEDTVVALKHNPFTLNTYGGFKFNIKGLEVDIWPQDTDQFIKVASNLTYLFNLKHQILIKNDE